MTQASQAALLVLGVYDALLFSLIESNGPFPVNGVNEGGMILCSSLAVLSSPDQFAKTTFIIINE